MATLPLLPELCGVDASLADFPNSRNHKIHCDESLIPSFLESSFETARTNNSHRAINLALLNKSDWLTPALKEEISSHFPSNADINMANGDRNQEKFIEECSSIFRVGRVFASGKQVHQAAIMFLDAWGVSCASQGKKISCHYSLRNRDKKAMESNNLHRQCGNGMKSVYDCKFHIMMSYIVSPKESKSFSSFLPARIASANYEHSHDLSTVTHRKAMKRSGRLTLELKPLQ
eukprot:scaffold91929_cov75-Attheya_sp.AAC.1